MTRARRGESGKGMDGLEHVDDLLAPRRCLCGMGCEARQRSEPRYCKDSQQSRPPAKPLALDACIWVGVKSGDFYALRLIPIAPQRGGVEIVNTF